MSLYYILFTVIFKTKLWKHECRAMPNAPKYLASVEVSNTYYYDSLFCFYYIKHFNIFKTLSVRYESSTGYNESTRMQHSYDFLK